MAKTIKIKGTNGDDDIIGTDANEKIRARKGNDTVDSAGGDDRVRADSGNDLAISRLSDNTTNIDRDNFSGGSGIDTLRFVLTQSEWLGSLALQKDLNAYGAFLDGLHHNGKGEAEGKEFRFTEFNLKASQFEKMEVVAGGITLSSTAQIIGTSTATLKEDTPAQTTATGTLTVLDLDAGESAFGAIGAIGALGGTYGDFTFNAATGVWTYTIDNSRPATNALAASDHVQDHLTVTSADGHTTGDIVISMTGRNDAPVAVSDSYATDEDTPLIIALTAGVLVNDMDPEGDSLRAVLSTGPAHGTLTLGTKGNFTYTPDADFSGTDSFTYKADDGPLLSTNAATVTITVKAVNDAPVASYDTYDIKPGGTLVVDAPGLLANDADPDGDTLSFGDFVTGAQHGTAFVNDDGSFSYNPLPNFHGVDSFSYTVTDGDKESNEATVTLIVDSAPVSALAGAALLARTGEALVNYQPAGAPNFSDPDGDTLQISAVLAGGIGALPGWLTVNGADGSLSGTPPATEAGHVISIMITAADPFGLSATLPFSLDVR